MRKLHVAWMIIIVLCTSFPACSMERDKDDVEQGSSIEDFEENTEVSSLLLEVASILRLPADLQYIVSNYHLIARSYCLGRAYIETAESGLYYFKHPPNINQLKSTIRQFDNLSKDELNSLLVDLDHYCCFLKVYSDYHAVFETESDKRLVLITGIPGQTNKSQTLMRKFLFPLGGAGIALMLTSLTLALIQIVNEIAFGPGISSISAVAGSYILGPVGIPIIILIGALYTYFYLNRDLPVGKQIKQITAAVRRLAEYLDEKNVLEDGNQRYLYLSKPQPDRFPFRED